MKKIDLHIHTTSSDGEFSPKEVVNLAIKKDMEIIAITDHDNISGIQKALEYSKNKNLRVIPGVEIGCEEKDLEIEEIHILGLFIDYQNKNLNNLLKNKKVNQTKCGIRNAINVIKKAKGIPILAHPGIYLNNTDKVIERFIGFGGEGIEVYYPYDKIYSFDGELKEKLINKFKKIAKEKDLFISGGSDFHNYKRITEIGEEGIYKEEFMKMTHAGDRI